MTVGFRERRSGRVLSQAGFERGNAETEASEANDCEGHPNDSAADVRAWPDGAGHLGAAAAQQDFGLDLSAAGPGGRAELAAAGGLRERCGAGTGAVPPGRSTAAGSERTGLAQGCAGAETQRRDAESALAGIPDGPSRRLWLYLVLRAVRRLSAPGAPDLPQPPRGGCGDADRLRRPDG